MNIPEDRHPLLYVYVDADQQHRPEKFRSRSISRGATALLGKWPDHLTFSWMMGVIGLLSLLTFFLLVVISMVLASSGHHYGKRFLIDKCERNAHVVQFVHMKHLEDLTVNENATYFVEVYVNETTANDSFCSIESFLRKTSSPVFLVLIFRNVTKPGQENLAIAKNLENSYRHFVTIAFDLNSFFNKTLFANVKSNDPKFLTFLAKVLVSWNVGGTVLDSKLRTVRNASRILSSDDKKVTVGTLESEVVLISAKKFCHAYIFDVLKTVAETRDIMKLTQVEIMEAARKRFCRGKWNCEGVKYLPGSVFCTGKANDDTCIFFKSDSMGSNVSTSDRDKQLCPLIGSFY